MKCPYCSSDKVKEGSDFYLCNNPHCLHIWGKKKTNKLQALGELVKDNETPRKRGKKK
ncbi:hypothetical protein M0R04_15715 [Candidatus Dojkabacteria bacterium]|jgi:hypothetical protein|nr:hypothetical protein [Candidatus Dojkabacteria bacterium]